MKTKNFKKKLTLNKKTVSNLSQSNMNFLRAGAENTVGCTQPGSPTCGDLVTCEATCGGLASCDFTCVSCDFTCANIGCPSDACPTPPKPTVYTIDCKCDW